MNVHDVLRAGFENELPDRFEKRQAFDVSGRSTNLGDDDVVFAFIGKFANAVFDYVGDVRNHLDGFAEIIAPPFFQNHPLVDLTAGEIVVAREDAIGEALVMTEVEIGLGSVVEHVNFAVLEWIHRSRIDIEIGIELLEHDAQTAQLEQRTKGSRG